MSELEKMERAKRYIDQLANGIDPLTGQELPEDSVLNQVRLSRCFFYVSDVLRLVIENGGKVEKNVVKKGKRSPFSLTQEQKAQVELSNLPLTITRFVERVNAVIDDSVMRKLKATDCTNWLLAEGYLQENINGGKRRRVPTQKGSMAGLCVQEKESVNGGMYLQVFYDRTAQQFLLNHLDDFCGEQT